MGRILQAFLIFCIKFIIIQNICKNFMKSLFEAYRGHEYVTVIYCISVRMHTNSTEASSRAYFLCNRKGNVIKFGKDIFLFMVH